MRDIATTRVPWLAALALGVAWMPSGNAASSAWISISGTRGVHEAVVAVAGVARARGLVPVLYLRTDFSMASARLQAMRETPPMQRALRGVAVISVEGYNDDSPYFPIQTAYWHSFHALDDRGEPTGPVLDPGTKDGPCANGDPVSCAAWISPFLGSLH
jgi:hypothetical protein